MEPDTNKQQVPNSSVSNHKGAIPIIFGIIIILIILVSGAYYLGLRSVSTNPFVKPTSSLPIDTNIPNPTSNPTVNDKGSSIVSVDSTWNKYTNYKLGFSMDMPKLMSPFSGGCKWNTTENSYRPESTPVPVKIFEEGNVVYISQEYYYLLGGERKVPQGYGTVSYFDKCDKIMNSLALLKDTSNTYESKWKITVDTVNNDSELTMYLQSQFGSSCSVGEKKPSKQNGVYDIIIKGDDKDLGETKCPLNYMYVVKYYPAKNKVASWGVGQACIFMNGSNCNDPKMILSFTFE